MHHVTMRVRQNLKLNMPRMFDQFFQIHFPIAKARFRLGLSLAVGRFQRFRTVSLAHTPASASGRGFEQYGVAHFIGQRARLTNVFQRSVRARHHRNASLFCQFFGRSFAAHPTNDLRRRSNEFQPRSRTLFGKFRAFGQKSVAWVHRIAPGGQCRRNQRIAV